MTTTLTNFPSDIFSDSALLAGLSSPDPIVARRAELLLKLPANAREDVSTAAGLLSNYDDDSTFSPIGALIHVIFEYDMRGIAAVRSYLTAG